VQAEFLTTYMGEKRDLVHAKNPYRAKDGVYRNMRMKREADALEINDENIAMLEQTVKEHIVRLPLPEGNQS